MVKVMVMFTLKIKNDIINKKTYEGSMVMRNFMKRAAAVGMSALLLASQTGLVFADGIDKTESKEPENGWYYENGKAFWYENGVRQGYNPSDLSYRGKEIYDKATDGWYWLDNNSQGAAAVSKDVYQESFAGQFADREDGMGKWVRYGSDGKMIKGWNQNEDGTYYFDLQTGAMAKGTTLIDGNICKFDVYTGIGLNKVWSEDDGVLYWYEDGVRQGTKGRGKEIYDPASTAWYWLDAVDNGKMAVDKDVYQESDGGKWVRYNLEGHMVKGWDVTENGTYYFDPVTGAMAKGEVYIDGQTYRFNENTGICETDGYSNYGLGVQYHTESEVRAYMAQSGASTSNATVMAEEANLSEPYSPGSLTQESLDDALKMLNQIRYIAGLNNNVTLNEEYNRKVQAGVMLNAANKQLSHYPSRPDGIDDELYNLGRVGTGSSNLAYTSWKTSLSYAISMWMDDSDSSNIPMVGHRRWILNPKMGQVGFGLARNGSGTYTGMYAFDSSNAVSAKGVAWPAMETPVEYFDRSIAWSYSYGSGISDASVTLTRQNDGTVWNFSESGSDGDFYVNNSGYGQSGCVIFRPSDITISENDKYIVTIRQADTVIANYTVHFF